MVYRHLLFSVFLPNTVPVLTECFDNIVWKPAMAIKHIELKNWDRVNAEREKECERERLANSLKRCYVLSSPFHSHSWTKSTKSLKLLPSPSLSIPQISLSWVQRKPIFHLSLCDLPAEHTQTKRVKTEKVLEKKEEIAGLQQGFMHQLMSWVWPRVHQNLQLIAVCVRKREHRNVFDWQQ